MLSDCRMYAILATVNVLACLVPLPLVIVPQSSPTPHIMPSFTLLSTKSFPQCSISSYVSFFKSAHLIGSHVILFSIADWVWTKVTPFTTCVIIVQAAMLVTLVKLADTSLPAFASIQLGRGPLTFSNI